MCVPFDLGREENTRFNSLKFSCKSGKKLVHRTHRVKKKVLNDPQQSNFMTLLNLLLLHSFAFVCLLASARGTMKITEIMYAPRLLDGDLEYVELHNSGSARVALDGFALRKLFTFPVGTNVESQAYVVVARNKTQFLRYACVISCVCRVVSISLLPFSCRLPCSMRRPKKIKKIDACC